MERTERSFNALIIFNEEDDWKWAGHYLQKPDMIRFDDYWSITFEDESKWYSNIIIEIFDLFLKFLIQFDIIFHKFHYSACVEFSDLLGAGFIDSKQVDLIVY